MKKILLFTLVMLVTGSFSYGQTCEVFQFGNSDNEEPEPQSTAPLNTCGTFSIRVKPIFILDENGQTNTTMADFMVGFNAAVGLFAAHGIYLDLDVADATTEYPELYHITQGTNFYLQSLSDLTYYAHPHGCKLDDESAITSLSNSFPPKYLRLSL